MSRTYKDAPRYLLAQNGAVRVVRLKSVTKKNRKTSKHNAIRFEFKHS